MAFLAPLFLLLLFVVPLVWVWPKRLTDRRHGILRTTVLALLLLALARPVVFHEDGRAWHVVVLDQSASTALDAWDAAQAIAGRAAGEDRTLLIHLGASLPEGRGGFDRRVALGEGSDLTQALAAAGRAIPRDARGSVTVLSDGLSTTRDWGAAVASLDARGVPVHTFRVPARDARAALIGLSPPAVLRVGATARFIAHVTGANTRVRVRLAGSAGELAVSEPVVLDGPQAVALSFEPDAAGYLPLRATVEVVDGEDDERADDTWRTTVAVQDPLRVLYLGSRILDGESRLDDLLGPGFELEAPAPGAAVPPEAVSGADLVLIDDRPADTLPTAVHEQVAEAVREGRSGLVMSGGRAAFGGGGYRHSPIAKVLPVDLVQKEEKRDPSTTLVVIIDTSGSMGGNRVQLAKEVARLSIRRLLPHDKVGIVEFYGAKRWAAPIQPASNAIEIQRALNRLNAGGGTVIMPAIEEAFYGLQNVRTRYKHVLVLTDGGVEQGAFEPLIRRMADKGINVSTVLVGPDAHSEFLVNIANWGKGRFYSVPNRFNLPEVLLKQPAGSHLPSWRPGQHEVETSGPAGWWTGVDRQAIPPLAGYVESQLRPGAEQLMAIRKTKHPVLATWRYGLGRVTTLLTEPTGPGTRPWRGWDDYGTWLARLLARTASDMHEPYAFELTRRRGALTLVARRLHPEAPPPEARFDEPGGASLTFRERAEGWYEARWTAAPEDEVRLLAGAGAQGLRMRLVDPAASDVRPELQVDPRLALDLGRLAAATDGASGNADDARAFTPAAAGGQRPVGVMALWPLLLALALLVYLGELVYRRTARSGDVA